MAQKGDLLSVRQDIRVVDATIRDGGLCNDFRFDDKFIKALYNANVKAGVDYMEFGYKASKEIFNEEDFGKWKFCNDADIRKIVGDNKTSLKIAVMADVGRTDFKKDIIAKKDSPIDFSAGIMMMKKYGEQVRKGEKLATLYTSKQESLAEAERMYKEAVVIGDEKPAAEPLVYARVEKDNIIKY